MTTEYEVVPESALRNKNIEYILGMHICQAIGGLQRQSRSIKGVELLYNQETPLNQDIVINSTQEGVKLIFDSHSQLLKMIEIYDLNKITLRYCSNIFAVPYQKTTVEQVEQAFGATHPGTYDSSLQMYVLSWRGISFSFPAESNVQPFYARGLSSLQFPNSSVPVVSKICIYTGNNMNDAKAPEMPLSCYNGNCHLQIVEIVRDQDKTLGLSITMTSESFESARFAEVKKQTFQKTVLFGDTSQDVMSALGCPNRLFFKSEDKMKIHLPSEQRLKANERADYFFNYFTLGLDILFDGESNRVKKFILHTNYPGHYDFGIYFRCHFKLNLNFLDSCYESAESDSSTKSAKSMTITTSTKWEDIYDLISDPLDLFSVGGGATGTPAAAVGQSGTTPPPPAPTNVAMATGAPSSAAATTTSAAIQQQSPVVLNRANTNNSTNPFGSTFCYCYQDIIFEIMPNNYIASLMIFDNFSVAHQLSSHEDNMNDISPDNDDRTP